jgi:thiamine pyrophosphokinase
MHAIVIANGKMEIPPNFNLQLTSYSMSIAADGGTKNCKLLGLIPQVLIGDLDSMQADEIEEYRRQGAEIIQFPRRKNETDLELAFAYAQGKQCDQVDVVGGLGARWDMTIANVLLLAYPQFDRMDIRYIDSSQEIRLLRGGKKYNLEAKAGDTLSLIPILGDSKGITTSNLEYPLRNENLLFGATRGISNVFTDPDAHIEFREGLMLCIINRVR